LNQHSIPQEILETFVVPFKYKILSWFLAVLIISVGIYASFITSDWLSLARAGAVIVVLSLALEASGKVDKYLTKLIGHVTPILSKIVLMQVKKNKHMYGLSGDETDEQLDQISAKESNRRLTDLTILAESLLYKDLRKTEFPIAIIGTTLWGFADLLEHVFPIAM
jgi:hypothetical protein